MILALLFCCTLVTTTHTSEKQNIVKFTITNAGLEVEGSMDSIVTDIHFNEKDLERSFIRGKVFPASIRTGIAIRDKHLRNRDYFDVGRFPAITLESRSLRRVSKNIYSGEFDLTIRHTTRRVVIEFKTTNDSGGTRYDASFNINRLDFGLGEKSIILDENVTIHIHAESD